MNNKPKAKIDYPTWLSTTDAARYLGIGERTLRTLTEAGHIPMYRIGRVHRYQLSDLQEYIAGARALPVLAQVHDITTKEQTA